MDTKNLPHLAAVLLIVGAWVPLTATAGIKCWTNNEGVKECGNSIPPEYAQQQTETKSKSGLTTGVSTRAKTAEEIAVEEANRKQEEAAAVAAAERKRKDQVLLNTFTYLEDVIKQRDDQLFVIDSRIRHTGKVIENLKMELTKREEAAAKLQEKGKEVGDDLKESISSARQQIMTSEKTVQGWRAERSQTSEQFGAAIARFKQLKGIP